MSDHDQDNRWIVSLIEEAPGKLALCLYERHEVGKPGVIIRVPLDLFVIERMHDLSGKVLWHHVRNMAL
jgi:hypothetical protein